MFSRGDLCTCIFKTGLFLLITFCALKFFFQKSNKQTNKKIKTPTKEKVSRKITDCCKCDPFSDQYYFMLVHLKYVQSTERKEKKSVRKFNCQQDNSPGVGDN